MVESVKRINWKCDCGAQADVEVISKEDVYSVMRHYCNAHVPDEARRLWRSGLYPGEERYIDTGGVLDA